MADVDFWKTAEQANTWQLIRAADRAKMLKAIESLAKQFDAEVDTTIVDRGILIRLSHPTGLGLSLGLEGDVRGNSKKNIFVLAWYTRGPTDNISGRLTSEFGMAQQASVNPHHRAKCTTTAQGFVDVYRKVESGLQMAKDRRAFEPT